MAHLVPVRAKLQWRSLLVIVAATFGAYTEAEGQQLGPCFGDCDDNGQVAVAELITGVNITLGQTPLDQCPEFDTSDDQRVTVDELTLSVNAALEGCVTPTPTLTMTVTPSATPTPTSTESPSPTITVSPTATVSPTTSVSPTETLSPTASVSPTTSPSPTATMSPTLSPSPTASISPTAPVLSPTPTISPSPNPTSVNTPGDLAKSVAGRVSVAGNAMGAIPSLITSIVSGFQLGRGSSSLSADGALGFSADNGSAAGSCPKGGTAVRSCTGFGSVTITITLTNCGVDTPDGSGTFSGTITLAGTGFCPLVLPPATLTVDLQGAFEDQLSNPTLNVSADLTGSVTDITTGGSCYLTDITLVLNGSLSAQVPGDGGTSVAFDHTNVKATVNQFNSDCVPVIYTLRFNGGATFTETSSGDSFDASFQDFDFKQDATTSPTEVELSGGMSSACFGGAVTIATVKPLLSQYGTLCFTGGTLGVTSATGNEQVLYFMDGSVGLDSNLDGEAEQTYQSCLVSELLLCSQ